MFYLGEEFLGVPCRRSKECFQFLTSSNSFISLEHTTDMVLLVLISAGNGSWACHSI